MRISLWWIADSIGCRAWPNGPGRPGLICMPAAKRRFAINTLKPNHHYYIIITYYYRNNELIITVIMNSLLPIITRSKIGINEFIDTYY